LTAITGKKCVHCAVRAWIINYNSGPCEICSGQFGSGNLSLIVLRFPSCQYHSTNAASCTSMCCSYQKDKREKPGNLRKINELSRKQFNFQSFP